MEELVYNILTHIFSMRTLSFKEHEDFLYTCVLKSKFLKKNPSLHFPLSNNQHQLSYTGVQPQNCSRRQNPHLVFYSNVLRWVQDTKSVSSKRGKSCTRWVYK